MLPPLRGALGCAALFFCSALWASGGLTVSPLRLEFTSARDVRTLSIENRGAQALRVQLRATRWTQDAGGRDVDEDTRDLLITPPLFELPPGARQTVRAGLRRAPDPSVELSYHLYVREVEPGTPGVEGLGLRFRLQHALPVFVAPRAGMRPDTQWSLARGLDGVAKLQVHNHGAAHERITALRIATVPADEALLDWRGVFYALPGLAPQDSSLTLSAPPGAPLRLVLTTGPDGAQQTRELNLTAPP